MATPNTGSAGNAANGEKGGGGRTPQVVTVGTLAAAAAALWTSAAGGGEGATQRGIALAAALGFTALSGLASLLLQWRKLHLEDRHRADAGVRARDERVRADELALLESYKREAERLRELLQKRDEEADRARREAEAELEGANQRCDEAVRGHRQEQQRAWQEGRRADAYRALLAQHSIPLPPDL